MCFYELRPERPLKKFYCLKLKEILFTCLPVCPYYYHHLGGSFNAFLHTIKCISLDFALDDEEALIICLVIPGHTPDCITCPAKQEHSILPLSNLGTSDPQNKSNVSTPEGESKEEWYFNRTTGGSPHV